MRISTSHPVGQELTPPKVGKWRLLHTHTVAADVEEFAGIYVVAIWERRDTDGAGVTP